MKWYAYVIIGAALVIISITLVSLGVSFIRKGIATSKMKRHTPWYERPVWSTREDNTIIFGGLTTPSDGLEPGRMCGPECKCDEIPKRDSL